jgi:NAD(P)-dependent dehydrogenase (short-subunit alcohol dehydrogenase family)
VRVPESGLELASLTAVQEYAAELRASDKGAPLAVLVNNAGVAWTPELRTTDGLELQFGVNHLGPFLLTTLLLDTLRGNARDGLPARVVNVSSDAHLAGSISPASLVDGSPPKSYSRFGAYCDSKLCNVLFARELARREAQRGAAGGAATGGALVAFAVHPGIVDTMLVRYLFPEWVLNSREQTPELSARVAQGLGLRSADEGAQGALWLATSDQAPALSGGYFVGPAEARQPSAQARDDDLARGLWAASEVLTARTLGTAPPAGALEVALRAGGGGGAELGTDLVPGLVRMLATNFA